MSLAGSGSSQPPSARSSMSTDSASDSDNESLLPTPHTAAVPTFHIHEPGTTPDRRNSTMSHGSDMLRGGRSSSESERLVARRQRKKGGQAEAVLDGAPGFGRSRSNGRTPAVIKVDDVAGLDAGHPENDASFTASPSTSTPIDPAPKGLNIPGLNLSLAGNIISRNFTDILPTPGEEASDVLSSLVPSPRKAFVSQLQSYESRAANARDAPVSPAWGSFDPVKPVFPQRDRASGSMGPPAVPSWATRRASGPNGRYMDMDMADAEGPSPKSGAPATFEEAPVPIADPTSPVPTHTHARNLSINFPHPGQAKVQHEQTVAPVAAAGKGEGFKGADGAFAFGAPLDQNTMEGQRAGKRRGHHHKHSLSHNFFSFLDPTKTDSTVDEPAHAHGRRQSIVSRKVSDAPLNVPMPLQDSALSLRLNSIATSSSAGSMSSLSAFTNKSDPMSQLLSSFALLEFIIGAALWVEGQMGGYRCLAGIGYLVVFDAMGVGVGVVARGGEGWRSVRTPYGMTRFLSLLYFSQCLFLVFSAVYIAKESLEQVVLGGHEHGGHSHGHAEHEDERPFPTMLLLCAMLSSALGGGVMHSHAKLVDAVGSLFLSSTYLSSPLVKRFPHLLANPFSLTVTAASGMLLLAGLVIPQHALSTLDGFAALVLTILTTALSLPPTKAFGQILLQTAPSGSTSQMRSFTRAIREIKDDRRVLGLRQTRCWAITAGSSPPDPATPLFDSPPITPSASSSNITGMLRKQSSFQFNRSETCSHSRDSTAPSSPTIARTSSRPGMPRRSSSAWYSPHGSPTVGEYGGVPSALYPSMRVDEGDAALVITVMLQVDRDMGDNEVVQLTKETWVKLSRVCGGGTRRVGEVCVGVERVDH